MRPEIKTSQEIQLMRESGRKLAQLHEELRSCLKPGITTYEINEIGDQTIRKLGGIPNFLGQDGYPASICISINEEVVHGIPSRHRYLEEGDIVSLDAGLIWKGWHSDAARTWGIGKISREHERLIAAAKASFFHGMKAALKGNHCNDISKAVEDCIKRQGFGIVKELAGHGIGRHLHEYPNIFNYGVKKRGPLLVPGMTYAVEPMITLGSPDIELDEEDGWTVRTVDRSYAAHYENTILITDGEPELLTMMDDETGMNEADG